MTLKEKLFRKSIGEDWAQKLEKNCPDVYKMDLADYKVPDYIKIDENGKVIYSPEMVE
nr:MAG TPA: hypothetical protein [Caudoviricetes sp.]